MDVSQVVTSLHVFQATCVLYIALDATISGK
jgi:hypothetical protein